MNFRFKRQNDQNDNENDENENDNDISMSNPVHNRSIRRNNRFNSLVDRVKNDLVPFIRSKCCAKITEQDIMAILINPILKNVEYDECVDNWRARKNACIKKLTDIISKVGIYNESVVDDDEEPPKKKQKLNDGSSKKCKNAGFSSILKHKHTQQKDQNEEVVDEFRTAKEEIEGFLKWKMDDWTSQRENELLKDPLPWYEKYHETFPGMDLLMHWLYCIHASNCASECMFCTAKYLVEGICNQTTPKKVNARVFCKSLYEAEEVLSL